MREPTPAEYVARLRRRYPNFCVSDEVWTQSIRDHLHPGQGTGRLRNLNPLLAQLDDEPGQPNKGDPP